MDKTTAQNRARSFGVRSLLTIGNPKTAKGEGLGYLSAILHLTPASASGVNLCPMAELAGCIAGCLNTAGRGGIAAGRATFKGPNGDTLPDNVIQHARLARSKFYTEDRHAFMALLAFEIEAHTAKAKREGLRPAVRLNGTSDIRWEHGHPVEVNGQLFRSIFDAFAGVQFYDYTKIPNRNPALIPDNYHLTWSYSEASRRYVAMAPDRLNWAVVFDTKKGQPLPETFKGRPVIDGDSTDLRFLDPVGVAVGLRAKGSAKRDQSGFVIRQNIPNVPA